MRKLFRQLSSTFVGALLLVGFFGVGLWLLAQIASIAGRAGLSPVAGAATRYRAFGTTGS